MPCRPATRWRRTRCWAAWTAPELTNRLAQEQASLQGLELESERAEIDHRKQKLGTQKAVDEAEIAARPPRATWSVRRPPGDKGVPIRRSKWARARFLQKAELTLVHAQKDAALERESLDF